MSIAWITEEWAKKWQNWISFESILEAITWKHGFLFQHDGIETTRWDSTAGIFDGNQHIYIYNINKVLLTIVGVFLIISTITAFHCTSVLRPRHRSRLFVCHSLGRISSHGAVEGVPVFNTFRQIYGRLAAVTSTERLYRAPAFHDLVKVGAKTSPDTPAKHARMAKFEMSFRSIRHWRAVT